MKWHNDDITMMSVKYTDAYFWSLMVTSGHSWSLVVTRGHSSVLLDTTLALPWKNTVWSQVRLEFISAWARELA